MPSPEFQSLSVESLADEYLDRLRRGENPSVDEYVQRVPALAEEIREFFPALKLVERFKPDRRDELAAMKPAGAFGPFSPLAVPRRLGDFRILREVARGGMGVVYEAVQESLGRPVALKVLPPNALADARHRKRFLREAKAAARLHHTNIVPVFGVGEADGVHFYAMQFINGLGLDKVLEELRCLRDDAGPAPDAAKDPAAACSQTQVDETEAGEVRRSEVRGRRSDIGGRKTQHVGNRADFRPPSSDLRLSGEVSVTAPYVAQSLMSGHFPMKRPDLEPDESGAGGITLGPRPATQTEAPLPDSPLQPTAVANRSHPPQETGVGRLSDTAVYALPGQDESSSAAGSPADYWQSVARIGVQVGEALQYAHDHGVLHRDVKPSNLLLDARGTAWVTDFGLAKAEDQDDITKTGDVIGTLRYMAPELFTGTSDARSDVYSLGLTLYELLALRPAFDETNRHKLVRQVMHDAPARLRTIDRHIPRDLEVIVHKAIDRDPNHRYRTAGELAADLQRFLGDEPIRARRVSYATRLRRWCRRNKLVATLVGTISLLLIAAVIVSLVAAASFSGLAKAKGDALHDAAAAKESALIEKGVAEKALGREIVAGRRERLRLAQMELMRGRMLCEGGRIGEGLLWIARSLKTAGNAGPKGVNLERVIRRNLDGWRSRICRLETSIAARSKLHSAAFSPDGKSAITSGTGGAVLWDLTAGRPMIAGFRLDRAFANDALFSPDNRRVILRGKNDVSIWDRKTRKRIATLVHPQSSIQAIALSLDGLLIATGCSAGKIRLWSVADGKAVGKPMQHPKGQGSFYWTGVRRIAFSQDGTMLLTARNNTAQLWRTAACDPIGEPLAHPKHKQIERIALSPDGRRIATAADGVQLWDATSRKPIGSRVHTQGSRIWDLAFSPDGKTLLTASANDQFVRFWSAEDAMPVGLPLNHNDGVRRASFSPNGKLVMTCVAATVHIWDLATRKRIGQPIRHPHAVKQIAFSQDGTSFLTCCDANFVPPGDRKEVRFWRLPTGDSLPRPLRLRHRVTHVAFWPTDDRYAVAGAYGTSVFHQGSSRPAAGAPFPVIASAFDSVGKTCAIVSDRDPNMRLNAYWIYFLSLQHRWTSGTRRFAARPLRMKQRVDQIALSPDGRRLVAVSRFARADLWNVGLNNHATRHVSTQRHEKLMAAAFHPGGGFFITVGLDGDIKRWDGFTGEPQGKLLNANVGTPVLAFSPDGTLLAISGLDRTVRVWNVATGEPLISLQAHPAAVLAVAVSRDNRMLVTGCVDGGVRAWDLLTGEQLGPTYFHSRSVTSVAIRPDGRQILSSSLDKAVQLWQVPHPMRGTPVTIRRTLELETGLALTADGALRVLNTEAWRMRKREFNSNPPPAGPAMP